MFECLMKYMFLDHLLDKKRDQREYCDGKCEYSCRILAFLGEWRWKTSRKRSSFDGFQLVFIFDECYPLFMASKFNWNLSAATTTTISIIIRPGWATLKNILGLLHLFFPWPLHSNRLTTKRRDHFSCLENLFKLCASVGLGRMPEFNMLNSIRHLNFSWSNKKKCSSCTSPLKERESKCKVWPLARFPKSRRTWFFSGNRRCSWFRVLCSPARKKTVPESCFMGRTWECIKRVLWANGMGLGHKRTRPLRASFHWIAWSILLSARSVVGRRRLWPECGGSGCGRAIESAIWFIRE